MSVAGHLGDGLGPHHRKTASSPARARLAAPSQVPSQVAVHNRSSGFICNHRPWLDVPNPGCTCRSAARVAPFGDNTGTNCWISRTPRALRNGRDLETIFSSMAPCSPTAIRRCGTPAHPGVVSAVIVLCRSHTGHLSGFARIGAPNALPDRSAWPLVLRRWIRLLRRPMVCRRTSTSCGPSKPGTFGVAVSSTSGSGKMENTGAFEAAERRSRSATVTRVRFDQRTRPASASPCPSPGTHLRMSGHGRICAIPGS